MTTSTITSVLTGADGLADGIGVHLRVFLPSDGPADFPASEHKHMRAPLLIARAQDSVGIVLIGRVTVALAEASMPEMTVHVEQAWIGEHHPGSGAMPTYAPWRPGHDDRLVREAAIEGLRLGDAHADPRDPLTRVVVLTKGISEVSRDSVEALRDLRYSAEHDFGQRLRDTGSLALPTLIELGIAASRARDRARDAVREGLQLWTIRNDVYHAHRRRLDPSLPPRVPPVADNALEEAWYPTFDAGIRQCSAMAAELEVEVSAFQRLLAAASTYSSALDVKAQEHFNFVATVGAVVLGLPALVLAAYGAATPDFTHRGWLVPLVGCIAFSLIFAVMLPGTKTWRERWNRSAWVLAASAGAALATLGAVHFRA